MQLIQPVQRCSSTFEMEISNQIQTNKQQTKINQFIASPMFQKTSNFHVRYKKTRRNHLAQFEALRFGSGVVVAGVYVEYNKITRKSTPRCASHTGLTGLSGLTGLT